jgi:hypothetical protein
MAEKKLLFVLPQAKPVPSLVAEALRRITRQANILALKEKLPTADTTLIKSAKLSADFESSPNRFLSLVRPSLFCLLIFAILSLP